MPGSANEHREDGGPPFSPYSLKKGLTSSGLHVVSTSPVSPDEGPPCTCPLCASDWSSCVPHSEGLQLSRDLGATYLELPSLNHVFVGRYFGSVVSDAITCVCVCVGRVGWWGGDVRMPGLLLFNLRFRVV